MTKLNRDILYLIIEQLQDDKNTLASCLLVNKTWCEIIIPTLWRNPWEYLTKEKEKILLNVIISHLSSLSRNKIGENELLMNSYQKPSFDYISFCRYLDLNQIQGIIDNNIHDKNENLKIQNEIYNLFINENMKFTHLYVHDKKFDDQIHFNHGAGICFSGIEFLSCNTNMDNNILSKLTETCRSIKKLKLFTMSNVSEENKYGIIKLIEAQRRLFDVSLIPLDKNDTFCNKLENTLIKHADNIQYFMIIKRPTAKILSSFVNLKRLELNNYHFDVGWDRLKDLSLPFLEVLKAIQVPFEVLTSLIKNTSGRLYDIEIDYTFFDTYEESINEKLIQAIHQNCPKLKYLKLILDNSSISELEKLLTRCQYLNGLYISMDRCVMFDWDDKLFEILTKSSPNNLISFIFNSSKLPPLESLKLFFDNWKGRKPMLLQIISYEDVDPDLIEKYKAEGIIKEYNRVMMGYNADHQR
ncbi:hypothetical protein GLOIN_2v1783316 [Rhizophagus clarus]|uniref:F-box domain-containing protein n=1 Tax=Rhizophagus clarus TaxID=94130 RepID=A0A8H3KRP0_9GLOM|nr:hypothetical protein GLOIN_2v1783316 [Rhizophagus clarus]